VSRGAQEPEGSFSIKMRIAQICLLLLGLGTASGEETVLPIVNNSASRSPVENTGRVTLTESNTDDGKAVISHSDDWQNISGKPSVAMVETLLIRNGRE
jgi:hypothetical protein